MLFEQPTIELIYFETVNILTESLGGGQGGGVVLPDDPDGF